MFPRNKKKIGYLDNCYHGYVLMKPSVSRWMFETAHVLFYAWLLGCIWALCESGFWASLWMWLHEGFRVLCEIFGDARVPLLHSRKGKNLCGATPQRFLPLHGEVGNRMKRNSTNSGIKTTASINR